MNNKHGKFELIKDDNGFAMAIAVNGYYMLHLERGTVRNEENAESIVAILNSEVKEQNQFQQLAAKCPIVCDICGGPMWAMPGSGFDNDRIVCAARDCGAEIEFPTSTECRKDTVA